MITYKIKNLGLVFILAFVCNFFGFTQIQKDSWRDHLPYNTAQTVAVADDKVYCAAEQVMFCYALEDNSVTRMSKTTGLSDLGIGYIAYSNEYNSLIIGYNNGNVDVIKNNVKYNFPDLKDKDMVADKGINHITLYHDKAYMSTGFGILVINLAKLEIADTYYPGTGGEYININATTIYNDTIYALLENGIIRGSITDPFLNYYEQWNRDTSMQYYNANFHAATVFNNQLFLVNTYDSVNSDSETETYYYMQTNDGSSWKPMFNSYDIIKNITSDSENLIIVNRWHVDVYDKNYTRIRHNDALNGKHALMGDDDYLYIADEKDGLLIKHPEKWPAPITPNSPKSNEVFALAYNNNEILVAPGGYKQTGSQLYNTAEIYTYKDNIWSYKDPASDTTLRNVRDIVCFATQNGNSSHYFAGSWGYGIVEIKDNKVENVFNNDNTEGVLGNKVSGCTFDNDGNLWAVCGSVGKSIVVKTPENNWYNFSYGGYWGNLKTEKIIYTSRGDFWTISKKGEGYFVWNSNNTPETENDDTYKKYELLDLEGKTVATAINDIVEDAEGDIWMATSDGVVIIDNPEDAIEADKLYARRPIIVIEGLENPLLENENVTAMAVDGGNRKWLGTSGGGLFLVSDDGTKQIMVFNEENSPLLSDNILALEIDQKTGELFIGTDQGIISYMTTSSGSKNSYDNLIAFPNPVKSNYDGLITIRGLMYESTVIITDLSGQMVYETTSNGGDAVWNGRDMLGNKVSSGVYNVLSTNADGSEGGITKILIVR